MGHAQRRLVSTAARLATSVHASNIKVFPPREALAGPSASSNTKTKTPSPTPSKPTFFSAETWAALQPPSTAALSTFIHRIGLATTVTSTDVIQQACTHPSYIPLFEHHNPKEPVPASNANLAALGNSLLGLFATEYVNATFPHLPTRVLKAAVSAYVGPTTCAHIATEMGAQPLLRWNRTPNTPTRPAVLHADAMASIPRALTAAVYQQHSLAAARKFVHRFFLSRDVDLRSMIKFRDPKLALRETVAKFGRERPVSRLLKETGRYSLTPVFVVGIYSGAEKLGEGFGSSLKMAEFRAAEDSLLRLYLTRQPPHLVQLPSSTFSSGVGDIFTAKGNAVGSYTPGTMADSEVLYGSSGKTGLRVPGARTRAVTEVEEGLEELQ
ncbi:60S ribosomal protein L3 [Cristinia sonorae]|uniref:Large ribosomal subunit protein mL44 n=1 Tax=Cristinia sonorae TaxID=1940300 RepID=A0A8K0UJF2_9AGAR|nr:60S ribosomal protein L3 [Cristinia sonorae]